VFPYIEQRCRDGTGREQRFYRGHASEREREREGGGGGATWSTELAVLLLLASVHLHTPGVEGEGEEVLQARGRAHDHVQALQPFLTLLEGGELTPGEQRKGQRYAVIKLQNRIKV